MGRKRQFVFSETMHVLDPLEVTMQRKPQQVCILALGDVLCYTGADSMTLTLTTQGNETG